MVFFFVVSSGNDDIVYDKSTVAIGLARVGQDTQKIVAGKSKVNFPHKRNNERIIGCGFWSSSSLFCNSRRYAYSRKRVCRELPNKALSDL